MKDIIGDIHGQYEKLEHLLKGLGYRHTQGAWRHPSRKAAFVGDFIDRGPDQMKVLRAIRDMVEAGQAEAVMGNHEFNAICWATPSPFKDGEFLRPHHNRNRHQHEEFLIQVGEDSDEHHSWINWFKELPMWKEGDGYRLIHACWHDESMKKLAPFLKPDGLLNMEHLDKLLVYGTEEYAALEVLCKGIEVDLPGEVAYLDAEGVLRTQSRIKWWDTEATTYRDAVLIPDRKIAATLPLVEIPQELRFKYESDIPVFFGHYWFSGVPEVLSSRFCCVDYSAAKGDNPLVAYQWDGNPELNSKNLIFK